VGVHIHLTYNHSFESHPNVYQPELPRERSDTLNAYYIRRLRSMQWTLANLVTLKKESKIKEYRCGDGMPTYRCFVMTIACHARMLRASTKPRSKIIRLVLDLSPSHGRRSRRTDKKMYSFF
jgi:hypothetical protein